jgi:ABC-type sugar transport system ATPase subunit
MSLAPLAGPASFDAAPAFDATAAPAVELRGATKRYGKLEAIRGVDLTIRPGEITAILGPNGAG